MVFTSYRFLLYLARLHQFDLLLDVVVSHFILALIMFASADFTLIYCLAVQNALISFYPAEIDDRLFTGLLHLNLGYPSCAIGTSFTTNRSIGR